MQSDIIYYKDDNLLKTENSKLGNTVTQSII